MRILAALSLMLAVCATAFGQELQAGDTIAIAVYQDFQLDAKSWSVRPA